MIIEVTSLQAEVVKQTEVCVNVYKECKKMEDDAVAYVARWIFISISNESSEHFFRCRTNMGSLQKTYEFLYYTQDMLNKTNSKVREIIRNQFKNIVWTFLNNLYYMYSWKPI